MSEHKPLSRLKRGEGGVVVKLERGAATLQLMEMGILPGEFIRVSRVAPLGDPISIEVHGSHLSLRRAEASVVIVELIES